MGMGKANFFKYIEPIKLISEWKLIFLPIFCFQVHRHGNHNYFKATFMWYHTDVNDRILPVPGTNNSSPILSRKRIKCNSLQFLCIQTIIASKMNFFISDIIPQRLKDTICDLYLCFTLCGNCNTADINKLGK